MTVLTSDRRDASAICRALVVGYHLDIDRGRATSGISAFAEDAEFEAKGRVMRGREAILQFFADREKQTERHTVHVIANESVVESRDGQVEIRAFVLLHVRRPDGEYALERVLDTRHTFREAGERWLISRRTSSPLHAA